MNVLATPISSDVPTPGELVSRNATAGSSPTNWLDLLNSKLQTEGQATPVRSEPAASTTPSATTVTKSVSAPESALASASTASTAAGPAAPTGTASASANLQIGRPSGQPQARLKRPGTADETAGAAELMAAFQFKAAPLPITHPMASVETGTVESGMESTGGNADAMGDAVASYPLGLGKSELGGPIGHESTSDNSAQPWTGHFVSTQPSGSADKNAVRPSLPLSPKRSDQASIQLSLTGSPEELQQPHTAPAIPLQNWERPISAPVMAMLAAPFPDTAGPLPVPPPEAMSALPKASLSALPVESGLDAANRLSSATIALGDKATEPIRTEPTTAADLTQPNISNEMPPPEAPVEILGTPTAQPESTMKSGREQSEIAGWFTRGFLTRQNSAGDGRRVQAAISTGWRTKHSAGTEPGEITALTATSPLTSGVPQNFSTDAMEVASHPSNLATHITEQAVHFKSSGLDSMQVVLKPDPKTEIHLEFVTRDGQIEAHARVASGDIQQLGHNWTHLQDSLAQQGIRLLPLSGSDSFAGGTGTQGETARRELPELPGNLPATAKPSAAPTTGSTADLTVRQLIKRLGLLDSWA